MSSPFLAADLGGTSMRAARVGTDGSLTALVRRPTPLDDPPAFLSLLREVAGAAGGLERAVIGVPGRVDHTRGRLEVAPNLPAAWVEQLREDALSERLGCPVHLVNDADLAAAGEARFGAGRGAADLVYVTLSTGVGAGVVLGGRVLRGRRSLGEVGHHVIDWGAWARGLPATFEELASGTALARTAARLGAPGTSAEVVERARRGDPPSARALALVIEAAALGIRNLAYLYSPERIVIGGGLGRIGEDLYGPVRAELVRSGPPGLAIEVVGAELGDDAALMGAAAWA